MGRSILGLTRDIAGALVRQKTRLQNALSTARRIKWNWAKWIPITKYLREEDSGTAGKIK